MNRIIKKSSALLFNLLIGFNVAGCSCFSLGEVYDFDYYVIKRTSNDYYKYLVFDSDKRSNLPFDEHYIYIVITGFTELGEQQERLDIPREIDGYPVRRIGRRQPGGFSFDNIEYIVNFPKKLKKLFVFNSLESVENCFAHSLLEVMNCDYNSFRFDSFGQYKTMFIYRDLYFAKFKTLDEGKYSPANITFMNNYPLEDNEDKYYRLDNVEKDEKLIEPPEPELEGYTFTGWYTEEECIYKYDFNTTLDIELGDEMVLYAGWEANA